MLEPAQTLPLPLMPAQTRLLVMSCQYKHQKVLVTTKLLEMLVLVANTAKTRRQKLELRRKACLTENESVDVDSRSMLMWTVEATSSFRRRGTSRLDPERCRWSMWQL